MDMLSCEEENLPGCPRKNLDVMISSHMTHLLLRAGL
jgi:hypothetical protein